MIKLPLHRQQQYAIAFKSNNNCQNKEQQYSDPLLNWPVRGLAYSNELGAALSEIAPKLGTLLWFPAMLYFGADFYDKYKNEKTSYNPNIQRGTQQVIFQILASVILPTAAVISGQKLTSLLGVFWKKGLTLQTQEEVIKFLQRFISRRHLNKFYDKKNEFKEHFEESLTTKREKLVRGNKIKNPIIWFTNMISRENHPETIALSKKEKVLKFADEKIDEIFKIAESLSRNEKPKEFSKNLWKDFEKLKTKYKKDPDYKDTYLRDASEDIIRKYQIKQIRKSKMLKTIGGFVALGLSIKPIDNFVEHIIIEKYVEPQLNYVFSQRNDASKYWLD